jgi:hypothetical protein
MVTDKVAFVGPQLPGLHAFPVALSIMRTFRTTTIVQNVPVAQAQRKAAMAAAAVALGCAWLLQLLLMLLAEEEEGWRRRKSLCV